MISVIWLSSLSAFLSAVVRLWCVFGSQFRWWNAYKSALTIYLMLFSNESKDGVHSDGPINGSLFFWSFFPWKYVFSWRRWWYVCKSFNNSIFFVLKPDGVGINVNPFKSNEHWSDVNVNVLDRFTIKLSTPVIGLKIIWSLKTWPSTKEATSQWRASNGSHPFPLQSRCLEWREWNHNSFECTH